MAELRVVTSVDPRAELGRLRARELNFDPRALSRFRQDADWHVDHYRISLPPESPGEVSAGGPWSVARELSSAYEFVDPHIMRAFYDPEEPLEGRTMLLEIHFWGLRIYAGVRVGENYDGYRTEGRRRVRVWAWNYRTLAGHFEKGQIDYEVRKWLDNGEVEFRIDAVSRRADAGHGLVDLGFLLFGRGKQTEFARSACVRMAKLTQRVLDGGLDPSLLRPAGNLTVRPSPSRRPPLTDFRR
jgi:hypothetical protein